MDASLIHAVEVFDCASKFALQSLKVIYFILKLRDAQFAVVEEFKTFIAARQPRRCQFKPKIMNLIQRDEDCRAFSVFYKFIGNARFLQAVDNVAGVFRLQIGI